MTIINWISVESLIPAIMVAMIILAGVSHFILGEITGAVGSKVRVAYEAMTQITRGLTKPLYEVRRPVPARLSRLSIARLSIAG